MILRTGHRSPNGFSALAWKAQSVEYLLCAADSPIIGRHAGLAGSSSRPRSKGRGPYVMHHQRSDMVRMHTTQDAVRILGIAHDNQVISIVASARDIDD